MAGPGWKRTDSRWGNFEEPRGGFDVSDERPRSSAPERDVTPGTMIGEYRVEEKIGEGGMASVYSAIHPLIAKRAAIKVLSSRLTGDDVQVERFIQEARSVNRIAHANIIDIFAFGQLPDGRRYFVMEWLSGETLGNRLALKALELSEIIETTLQITDALEAAHEAGVIHRDLKPDNVFLVPQRGGRTKVKLLDFGIAKLVNGEDARLRLTGANFTMGTPEYLSPEQARGRAVDPRSDIYSLGVMAFEMCTRRLPFEGDNVADLIAKHLTEPAPAPSSVSAWVPPLLDRLIRRMLEKDPAGRPTLGEVRECLLEVAESNRPGARILDPGPTEAARNELAVGPTLAAVETVAAPARMPWWRKRLAIALAALAVSAFAITLVVGLRRRSGAEARRARAAVTQAPAAPQVPSTAAPHAAPIPAEPVAPEEAAQMGGPKRSSRRGADARAKPNRPRSRSAPPVLTDRDYVVDPFVEGP